MDQPLREIHDQQQHRQLGPQRPPRDQPSGRARDVLEQVNRHHSQEDSQNLAVKDEIEKVAQE